MVAPAARQNPAVNVCVCPSATFAVAGDTALAVSHVIETLALADFVASATLVAVTVTVEGVGTVAGAVYNAVVALDATIVPEVVFPPGIPLTLQATFAFSLLPFTVTVNSWAPDAGTLALVGEI